MRRKACCCRDEQFVRPEVVIRGAADGNVQSAENSLVKGLAGGEVTDDLLNVIDKAAAVQFLRFHKWAPGFCDER